MILQTQVQDSDILKFATTFNDHAYCATPRNSNTPVKDFELVDDLREEGDEKPKEEKPTVKGKGKKKKGPAPGTRYKLSSLGHFYDTFHEFFLLSHITHSRV